MNRSTVLVLSGLAVFALHAIAGAAQALPPQLQTDNSRRLGGETSGAPQLQTDTGRRVAEQEYMAAKRAQADQANGGYPPGFGPGGQDGESNASAGDALRMSAAADAINIGSRYTNSRIIGRGGNAPLEVGSDGIIRPARGGNDGR